MLAKYRAHQKRSPFRWTSRSPSVAQCKGWVYSSTIEKGRVFDAQHMANIRNISWGQCAVGPNPNLIATLSSRYFWGCWWKRLSDCAEFHGCISWKLLNDSKMEGLTFTFEDQHPKSIVISFSRKYGSRYPEYSADLDFVIIFRSSSTNKSRSKVKQNFCRVRSCHTIEVLQYGITIYVFLIFFFFFLGGIVL